jgi:hypothetical protein
MKNYKKTTNIDFDTLISLAAPKTKTIPHITPKPQAENNVNIKQVNKSKPTRSVRKLRSDPNLIVPP